MIGTLILGWILTWFDLHNALVDGINQLFNTNFNVSIYWLIFLTIGIIIHFIKKVR